MAIFAPADEMHRLAKRAMDNGIAQSRAEAESILRGYRISLVIAREQAVDMNYQAALLTAVALGRRVFLGGVMVSGELDVPLVTPLPFGKTLRQAVVALGGIVGIESDNVPLVSIGGSVNPKSARFHIRTIFDGWRGGIVPGHAEGITKGPRDVMALSPMLAAALAINEVFLHLAGDMPSAGRRIVGLSLWDVSPEVDWLSLQNGEPDLTYLPTRLWLIGLGHLGQAYLWALGLLPYADPNSVRLILQDSDIITPSSESTSMLTDVSVVGRKKTRVLSTWAECRGFETTITERLFDKNCQRRAEEPGIALCGMDNAAGRRALDQAGFDFVVEAGLGRGHNDFRSLLIHTLPGNQPAAELWKDNGDAGQLTDQAAAYQRMLEEGSLDRCGVTLLAGKAVGAPFVGAVAATLAIAEILRLLQGGKINRLIEMNLVNLDHYRVAPQMHNFMNLNPGFGLSAKF